ncbi:MAG: TRAP transporter substrate-binding protein [Candidatus Eremiobacteraeota bacterium]|nr:TRAP transporter substrate-binding protein [Candidatus Eremiobacteraeota bacterium]MBV8354849.1 TRAP transporter substrate-binding protein [Candidatus Eremiobacteraeota bacterium]
MDRKQFLVRSAGAGALIAGAPPVARGAAPMTLRFAHFAAADHPANVAAKQFAERVKSRTQGAIEIAIFPNNQLGDPPQQAAQIRDGVIDMGLPTQGQLDKYDKAFTAVMMPFAFKDRAEAFKVLDGPAMDWLAPLAAKQNFILLHNWDYGFRNITNNTRPINTPEDVKGLKLRTPPEVELEAAMEALGAIVTPISFAELYLALSQKVVDGEENPIAVIYYNKFYEVQKHLALTHHVYNNMIHAVSASTWAKLTPAQQQIFREESAGAAALMRRLMGEQESEQIAKLEASGMKVTRPDIAAFRARMDPAYKKIAAYSGPENVDKFLAMIKKAQA